MLAESRYLPHALYDGWLPAHPTLRERTDATELLRLCGLSWSQLLEHVTRSIEAADRMAEAEARRRGENG